MKKYKYSVPIMNATVTVENRGEYLRLMKEAGVERVLLCICDLWDHEPTVAANIASLKANIAFFEENGIEAGIWQGDTLGHGVALSHALHSSAPKPYSPIVNLNGTVIGDTRCPLDEDFKRDVSDYLQRLARETGARLILLDDDFRIARRSDAFCCACEKHLAWMSELCGEELGREELSKKLFEKPNKYRSAYIKATGDSLRALAAEMRRTMDEFDPTVRIGICCVPSAWNLDGASGLEIARILAGNTEPFLRLSGAPYWAVTSDKTMPMLLETERMLLSLCPDGSAEIVSEGDVYPRPRYTVPAAHLELFDAAMRASGFGGILKYMFDYNTSPHYDPSYVKHHCRNLPLHEAVGEVFDGKTASGVLVYACEGVLDTADFTLSSAARVQYLPTTNAGSMLQNCGIPTVYGKGEACAVAVFGEAARKIPLDMLQKGAILDGVAAAILSERGVDVGLRGDVARNTLNVRAIKTEDEANVSVYRGSGTFITAPIAESARILACAVGDGRTVAYRYRNADGQSFTVFTFDSDTIDRFSSLTRGFAIEKILFDGIAAVGGRLPAHCPAAPDLYTLCSRGEHSLAIGFFNCYADDVLNPVIALDRAYTSARFVGCEGRLEGDRLILSDIPAYKSVAIEVFD
ncbi:MAG: hypothetical protein E7606_03920 [Ruminococcaceae bacterium]|nr:hypothetical protein [Oscillospiraceae bacterium]